MVNTALATWIALSRFCWGILLAALICKALIMARVAIVGGAEIAINSIVVFFAVIGATAFPYEGAKWRFDLSYRFRMPHTVSIFAVITAIYIWFKSAPKLLEVLGDSQKVNGTLWIWGLILLFASFSEIYWQKLKRRQQDQDNQLFV